jgi:MFS family permease
MTATTATTSTGRALSAAVLVAAAGMLPVALTGALAVQLRSDLGMQEVAIGIAVSVFFAAGAATALPSGRFADRHGWRAGTILNGALSLVALLGAATLSFHPVMLIALLGLAGVGMAGSMSASNLALARETPPVRLGLLMAVKQAAIPIATLLAGLAVPVVALTIGWRWAFAIAALVPLGAIVVSAPGASKARTAAAVATTPRERVPVSRDLVVLSIACAFASVIPGVLAGFVVVSAVTSGIAEGTSGFLLMGGSAIGLTVRVVMGWRIDRVASNGFREVAVLLAVGAGALALMATGRPVLFAVGALVAFGSGWGWPALFFYGVVRSHMDAPAAATGAIQSGGAVGTAVGPLLFGVIAGGIGHGPAWAAAAGVALVAAVLSWMAAGRGGGQG